MGSAGWALLGLAIASEMRAIIAGMSSNERLGASEAKLWALVEERTHHDADTVDIDRRIWELFGEKWAIVFTDLSGFSRRTAEFGIIHFLQVIHEQRKLLLPIVERFDGLLVKAEADSFLLLFRNPVRAFDCAVAMRRACRQVNERRRPEEQILLCQGIGYGDVLKIGDQDVWGREVNAASKLGEDTAASYEILVTDAVRVALAARTELEFESIDEVVGSVAAFRVLPEYESPSSLR